MSESVKQAVEKSDAVKKLVLLSSVGAQYETGVVSKFPIAKLDYVLQTQSLTFLQGEIKSNNKAESILRTTNVSEITFVRCSYFMENWGMCIPTLLESNPYMLSVLSPSDWKIPMVTVKDIGQCLADELIKPLSASKADEEKKLHIYELHGPRGYDCTDVQEAFSKALGKPIEVKPVEKDKMTEFWTGMFPPDVAREFAEMTLSFLPGGVMEEDCWRTDNREIVRGKTELGDAFAALLQPPAE